MNDRQLDINVRHAFVALDLNGGGRVTAEMQYGTGLIRVTQEELDTLQMLEPLRYVAPERPGLRVELTGPMQTVTYAGLKGAQFRDVPRGTLYDGRYDRFRY